MPRYRLNCRTCTEVQKRYRGCETKSSQPFILEIDGKKEEIWQCPFKLVTFETMEIMRFHRFYKEGFLPAVGAISQQSPILLDAFEIIDNEKAKIKEQENASGHK